MPRLPRSCAPAVVALALVAGLAACGDDDDVVAGATTSGTAPASTAASTPTTAAATSTTRVDDDLLTDPQDATDDVLELFTPAPSAPSAALLADQVVDALADDLRGDGDGDGPTVVLVALEGAGPATATIDVDGFADDSVAGARYVVELVEGTGTWSIVSAERAERCARAVDTSGERCV